jgi:hypothetical protein
LNEDGLKHCRTFFESKKNSNTEVMRVNQEV